MNFDDRIRASYADRLTRAGLDDAEPPSVPSAAPPTAALADRISWSDPARRRLSAAVILVAVLIAATGALVLVRSDGRPDQVTTGPPPGPPGVPVVTAGRDWVAANHRGWLFQYPKAWQLTEDVSCPGIEVDVFVAPSSLDTCTAVGTRSAPIDQPFVAVVRRGRPGVGSGSGSASATAVLGPVSRAAVMFAFLGADGFQEVMFGGPDAPTSSLANAVGSTFRAPTTPDRDVPSLRMGSESLADRIHRLGRRPYDVYLPRRPPVGTSAREVEEMVATSADPTSDPASAVNITLTLEAEPPGGGFFPPTIRICSGTGEDTCLRRIVPSYDLLVGGLTWRCADGPRPSVRTCRRDRPDGSWVSFTVEFGTFTDVELDQLVGDLTSDVGAAEWAHR